MMSNELYVSLETAKLLKQTGFDWSSFAYYDANNILCISDVLITKESSDLTEYINCLAPTLDVAQKWLRENLKIYVTIDYFPDEWKEEGYPFFEWKIRSKKLGKYGNITGHANTYEQALENGIQRALINYLQGML